VEKAPFDFLMNVPGEKCIIVGAVIASGEDGLAERTEELLSVSRVINAHPLLITEKKQPFRNDAMFVCADELAAMRWPVELAQTFR
jgi:hypothetical protein